MTMDPDLEKRIQDEIRRRLPPDRTTTKIRRFQIIAIAGVIFGLLSLLIALAHAYAISQTNIQVLLQILEQKHNPASGSLPTGVRLPGS